jgi:hypothetical protein
MSELNQLLEKANQLGRATALIAERDITISETIHFMKKVASTHCVHVQATDEPGFIVLTLQVKAAEAV